MKKFILLFFALSFFASCVPKKRLTYLQEKEHSKKEYQLQRSSYRVQPNDILSITVRSLDTETSVMFNISGNSNNALNAGDILFYLQGYSINLEGQITMPVIGVIQVIDKTVEQIEELIQNKLSEYFSSNAINVSVQLAGIRFSTVGEVNRPGKYVIYQNQVNIFEALAHSGDISIVGDRKQVMIVRQQPGGRVQTFSLDLTNSDVINDPAFFIQPNDIINVKPLAQKSYGIGTTGFQTFSQLLSVVASTITLIIAINSLN